MNTITVCEGVTIFYKDWGPEDGHPIVSYNGWPLRADTWEGQMLYFANNDYASVGHDGCGPAGSFDAGDGHNTYQCAADVVTLVMHLNRPLHAQHPTGRNPAKHRIGRCGYDRGLVAELVLIGAVPPMVAGMAAKPDRLAGHISNAVGGELSLFNRVVRSWLFAVRIGEVRNFEHDAEVLALGQSLYDITRGSCARRQRFEMGPVNLAPTFAGQAGVGRRRAELILDSIALNSTASIARYQEPEVALCNSGVTLDVIGWQYELVRSDASEGIARQFPSPDSMKRMTRCFCHIGCMQPGVMCDNLYIAFGKQNKRAGRTVNLNEPVLQ
jgi:pimeloyl-ACP methyl ester carboxylesterase